MLRTLCSRGPAAGSVLPQLLSAVQHQPAPASSSLLAALGWGPAPVITRGLADSAAVPTSSSADGQERPKEILRDILGQKGALTSGQIWELAETKGMTSKRYVKKMLDQMKKERQVYTVPPEKAQELGFKEVVPMKPQASTLKKGKKSKSKVNRFSMVYTLPIQGLEQSSNAA
eukprot:jgi/Tetstr1/456483/TSEL_043206.t1